MCLDICFGEDFELQNNLKNISILATFSISSCVILKSCTFPGLWTFHLSIQIFWKMIILCL